MTLGFFGILPQLLYFVSYYHYFVSLRKIKYVCMYVCIPIRSGNFPQARSLNKTMVSLLLNARLDTTFSTEFNLQV